MGEEASVEAASHGGRAGGDPARWAAIVFWAAAVGSVAMTIVVRQSRLLPGEVAVMQWVRSNLSDAFVFVGPALDVAFAGVIPPVLFAVLVALVWWRWGRYPATIFLLAGSVTGLTKLADLARRPRPTDDLAWGDVVFGEGGYPSGHVVYTVMVFGMLAYLASRHVDRRPVRHLLQGVALTVVVATGPSRLVEVDHWPADVVAGYLIAIAGLAGAIWLERRLPLLLAERRPRVGTWLQVPVADVSAAPSWPRPSAARRPNQRSLPGPDGIG